MIPPDHAVLEPSLNKVVYPPLPSYLHFEHGQLLCPERTLLSENQRGECSMPSSCQLGRGKSNTLHCLFVSILLDALLRLQAVCLRGMGSIFHTGSQKIELYSLHIYFSYFEVNSVLRSMPPDESETV